MEKEKNQNEPKQDNKQGLDIKQIGIQALVQVGVALLTTLIVTACSGVLKLSALPKEVGDIHDSLNQLKEDNDAVKEQLASVQGNLSIVNEIVTNSLAIYVSDLNKTERTDTGLSVEESKVYQTSAGEKSAKELQNQRIITSYKEDGLDVVFVGQYNEKYHWQGNCIINAYKDGILNYAEAAVYNDGERTFNEQLFNNGDTWVYVKRIQDGDINSGDTWKYEKTKEIFQSVSIEQPSERDLIIPGAYVSLFSICKSHYHGDTSDGQYNDESGNAYLITYKNGYTKTLYYTDHPMYLHDNDSCRLKITTHTHLE
ncbi:MAG: hypothetical protein K5675_04840 [Lachnospiraceae bacterium]|nr:hypothetical protein [Lachnospiraceae bacterium]